MSTDSHATTQSPPPSYPQRTRTMKAVIGVAAVLVSSTLMVGVLGLFEIRSTTMAMARASVHSQPAIDELAVRTIVSAPRA